MADLGMRPSDLAIKIKEKELAIEEKRFTQARLSLELMRSQQHVYDYGQSIIDIEQHITEVDNIDLESLRTAYASAVAAENGVEHGGH